MATTLTLRTLTNTGDTTVGTSLTYEQVDSNFIQLKNNKAEVNSPQLEGIPTTPTFDSTDSSNKIASTSFVHNLTQTKVQESNDNAIAMAIALG